MGIYTSLSTEKMQEKGNCPPKKNESISHFRKCPKTTFVYVQVTKPSSGRRNYGQVRNIVIEPQREEVRVDGWINKTLDL